MRPDNYCLVTQRIGAILEDSPDDNDRTPDYTDVSGDVLFTPSMSRGDAFHIERDGEIVTVPVYSVRAKIVDGVLQHEGEVGIPLFAGGEGVNPSSLVYRVAYSRLKANGESVELNSFSFKAIPGGSVDLTTVAPVAGTPSPGIVRGAKGDRGEPGPQGERGPQGVVGPPGPQGEPGEVTLAQLNQAIRVDTSVGTRVFTGDTMIYGDTGWRDMSQFLIEGLAISSSFGRARMRRVAGRVYFDLKLDVTQPGLTAIFEGVPTGFRAISMFPMDNQIFTAPTTGAGASLLIPGTHAGVFYASSSPLRTGTQTPWPDQGTIAWTSSYFTSDPWPTSLPGNPA